MPPLTLEGKTLGSKHKHFNSQLENVVKDKTPFDAVTEQYGDSDIDHLMKIEVASKYRHVEYILEVLKSEDMLYVSRAIKKSTWLITDDQYAHIINPQYLYSDLFPYMTAKAICKLLFHIRLNLKDELRVEEFHKYYAEINLDKALVWLPNCSVSCIEKFIEKHPRKIEPNLFKRLCDRSPALFEIFMKNYPDYKKPYLKVVLHLLNKNTDMYLNVCEKLEPYNCPNFGKRHTAIIMKKCPDRILNNFEKYSTNIDVETVAKHLGPEKIKDFIFKLSKNKDMSYWFSYDNIRQLIKYLPKEGKFQYLKSAFIDKSYIESGVGDMKPISDSVCLVKRSGGERCSRDIYQWYNHAPFDIAFPELKNLIKIESSPDERGAILRVMLTTAGRNMDHIQTVLQYYHDKHINEPFRHKINFVNAVISLTDTHRYNETMWKILDELFHNLEVYIESDNSVQTCIEAILVYKVLHKQPIPEMVEKKFNFTTLKEIKNKMNKEEKEAIFEYLYNFINTKMEKHSVTNQDELRESITHLCDYMTLLLNWDKDIVNYPSVLQKIRDIIKFKHEKAWTVSLESVYNKKKSWRKYMFEESLLLSRNEDVCINALKHDPMLLQRHSEVVDAMCSEDSIVLGRLLSKLKIYWAHSLSPEWATSYRNRINNPKGHQAMIRGLCALLPRRELLELFEKYIPDVPKIVWSEIDENLLSLRKNLARLMHFARPHPPPSSIIPYAQGDYLQYALPSLSAIFYNLSAHKSREQLSQLLSGPVSVQKHGIRMAFSKLKANELKDIFSNIWKTTRNATIRAVIFQLTYNLLHREKNPTRITEIWQLLDMFIDNLSSEENSSIYTILGKVQQVPKQVRSNFCMKSYKFLKTLPAKANCQTIIEGVALSTGNLMDTIDPEFVADILLDFIEEWLVNKKIIKETYGYPRSIISVIVKYILCTDNEADQKYRFDKVMKPFLSQIVALWNEVYEKEKYMEGYFRHLISTFASDVRDNFLRTNYVIPLNIFVEIINVLETNLTIEESYFIITYCKLLISYINSYNKVKSDIKKVETKLEEKEPYDGEDKAEYQDMYSKISPFFAEECIRLLKDDVEKYFPSIQVLFTKVLKEFVGYIGHQCVGEFYFEMALIKDVDCIPGYMMALTVLPHRLYDENKDRKLDEVRTKILEHPSKEVRIHYYKKYSNYPIMPLK